jgi:hypothetical protein
MRPEVVVGAGAALLIGALAGVEWWAEHHWPVDVDAGVRSSEAAQSDLPEMPEFEAEAAASPRLIR